MPCSVLRWPQLRAHARHDGLVGIATLLAFLAGEDLAALAEARTIRRPGTAETGLPALRRLETLRGLRSLPLEPLALGDRLLLVALLAFIVVIEERALGADDLHARLALRLVAVIADQRTYPGRP